MKKIMIAICCVLTWVSLASGQASEKGVVSEVYFSPIDQVADKLIAQIDREKESIHIAVYCLMHAGIAKALKEAHSRGVDVQVILDPFSIKVRSPIAKMVEKGIPVFVWNPDVSPQTGQQKRKKPLMHDKFCVFGNRSVWTGSFNFTREGALSNRENVVILQGADVAKRYLEEFAEIKRAGCCSYQAYQLEKEDRSQEVSREGKL